MAFMAEFLQFRQSFLTCIVIFEKIFAIRNSMTTPPFLAPYKRCYRRNEFTQIFTSYNLRQQHNLMGKSLFASVIFCCNLEHCVIRLVLTIISVTFFLKGKLSLLPEFLLIKQSVQIIQFFEQRCTKIKKLGFSKSNPVKTHLTACRSPFKVFYENEKRQKHFFSFLKEYLWPFLSE